MTDYAIEQWRRERLECISKCDICQKPSTEIHEIARGANRKGGAQCALCSTRIVLALSSGTERRA
jgi:hypothetical protein